MITAIVGTLVLILCGALIWAVATERGPGPEDVAVAYELAWDKRDFESLYTLAGRELRDGLDRRQFIGAKRAAFPERRTMTGLVSQIGVADSATAGPAAIVATRVESHDGIVVCNCVDLARRNGHWEVVGYRLAPNAEAAPAPAT